MHRIATICFNDFWLYNISIATVHLLYWPNKTSQGCIKRTYKLTIIESAFFDTKMVRNNTIFLTNSSASIIIYASVATKKNLLTIVHLFVHVEGRGAPNLVPLFPLCIKIDLICLSPYHWQPCVSNFCDIKKRWLSQISCRISNLAFLILQEILQIGNFLQNKLRDVRLSNKFCKVILFWYHETLKRRAANGTESKRLNQFL